MRFNVRCLMWVVLAFTTQGCVRTLRTHLQDHEDSLPKDYGLILPWTGNSYLGYQVTAVDNKPVSADGALADVELPGKRPISVGVERCFAPKASARDALPGSWSSEFNYDAKQGMSVEIPAKCLDVVTSEDAYQSGTFKLKNVRVFQGLGHPAVNAACIPAQPDNVVSLYDAMLLAIDRVAIAEAITLQGRAGVTATAKAVIKCIQEQTPNAKVSLEVKQDGSFEGNNIVIAARPVRVHLSSFAGRLRPVPGGVSPQPNAVVFAADEGANMNQFMGKPVPAYLQSVSVSHVKYDAAASWQVQVRVTGFAALDKAPEGQPASCQLSPGTSDVYLLNEGGSCVLYDQEGKTSLQIGVTKQQDAEKVSTTGLLQYYLRAFHWDQVK
jgi:hypothetical protein